VKISRNLPQFRNKKALIVLTGKEVIRIMVAEDGGITDKELYRIKGYFYPDRQGYMEQLGKNRMLMNWGPFDIGHDTWKEREFLLQLRKRARRYLEHEKPDEVYLFAEHEEVNKVKKQFPHEPQPNFVMVVPENMVRAHPFDILLRIKTKRLEEESEPLPLRPEPRKIMIVSEKAQKLIRVRKK
jgi:hypothetical protein